jgi:hypothetical protein
MKRTSNLTNNHSVQVPPAEVVLRERIEERAYHLWLAGGCEHGDHLRHWLLAEGEVLKAVKQDQEERATARKKANRQTAFRGSFQ